MLSRPEISVVILCYKAGDFAPIFVSQMEKILKERELDYELVLVANFNKNERFSDSTPEIVRKLAAQNPRITPVIKEKEGMMGWDMRTGLMAASGRTVGVIDGDGQMPPEDIWEVYRALKNGDYDMAKTYRRERHDGLIRLLVSRIYNSMLKTLFPKVKVKDANSKPKIFTYEALHKLNLSSDDWFVDAEIIIQASSLNFRIGEISTIFYQNPKRSSFINLTAIFNFAFNLLKYRVKTLWENPLRKKS